MKESEIEMTLLGTPTQITGDIRVDVLTDRCAGCQECYVRCPTSAIGFDSDNWIVTVDATLCVGCRQCVRVCPFSAIEVHGEPLLAASLKNRIPHDYMIPALAPSRETREGFANFEDALLEANRCLECPDPTCVRGCPAHNDIPAMIAAVREQDLQGARRLFEATSHLGSICSRVCDQTTQCEGACSWTLAGQTAVAIGLLERFVFDNTTIDHDIGHQVTGKVAIVGSGPAALGSAWELVKAGAQVTVFEAGPRAGGLLNHGIPEFTLPLAKVNEQWETLVDLGLELVLNHHVSKTEVESFRSAYDGIILAHGAQNPIRPSIPGIDSPHVIDAMDFLSRTGEALHDPIPNTSYKGKRIAILGAGNTAMDVGRMAVRFGAQATAVEWVNESFSRVRVDELQEARKEGVQVSFLTTISNISDSSVTLVHTTHHDPKKLPEIVKGSETELPVDLVVLALGYRLTGEFEQFAPLAPFRPNPNSDVDFGWISSGLFSPSSENHKIGPLSWSRDIATHRSQVPFETKIFVAGDALIGQSTVVEAMAQGREAARKLITTLRDNLSYK